MGMKFVLTQICPYFDCDYEELNQNTGFDRLKIVVLFGPACLKLWGARRKETFHTVTDFALSHVLRRNSK